MERRVVKQSLSEFRAHRKSDNPWKHRSYEERLIGMAVICGTHETHGQDQSRLSRVYRITRGKKG